MAQIVEELVDPPLPWHLLDVSVAVAANVRRRAFAAGKFPVRDLARHAGLDKRQTRKIAAMLGLRKLKGKWTLRTANGSWFEPLSREMAIRFLEAAYAYRGRLLLMKR